MDSLRTIILTLTPSEKRYFGMFATAFKTESGLMKLFELTGEKQEHDEKTLIRKTGIKNIAEGRSRLRKLLFKAMRSYNEDVSVKQQLRDTASDVEFLERKKLRGEARKEVNKGLKLAEKNEEFMMLSAMMEMAGRNLDTRAKPDVVFSQLAALQEQVDHSLSEGAYLLQANMISYQISGIMGSTDFSSIPDIAALMAVEISRIRRLLELVKTPYTRIFLLTMCIFCEDEADISEEDCAEVLSIYQSDPALILRDPIMYDKFLQTYCRKIVWGKEYKMAAYDLLQKIDANQKANSDFFKQYPGRLSQMVRKNILLKLYYCRAHDAWDELCHLEAEIKQGLTLDPGIEDTRKASNVSVFISCLYLSGDYAKTLEWINVFYALPEASFRKPLMIGVRMIEAFAFHRLRQFDLSKNKAMNLYKTIAEQHYTDDYHKHISTVLRKLNNWNLKLDSDLAEIKELAANFVSLRLQNDEQYVNYFCVLYLEAMLEGLL